MSKPARPTGDRMKWVILAFLLAVTSINYLDRLLLSVLAPVLRDDFHFTERLYGNVNAIFQIFYALGFLVCGMLLDRYGVKKALAMGALWWSLASAMHASVTSAAQFGVWRAMLGLSEAINFPACNKAVAEWFPAEDRALATGIFNSGPNLASVLGPPVFVVLTASFGWRFCFLAVSLAGLLWVAVWVRYYPARVEARPSRTAGNMSFGKVLRFRPARGFALSKVLVDPLWYFLLFWLPLYFRDVRGLEMSQIGWALPCIYFSSGVGSVTAGWFSGFLMRKGKSKRAARLMTLLICAVLVPVGLSCAVNGSLILAIAMFSVAAAAHQGFSSISFTLPGDVFPAQVLGTILGFGSFAGTVSSVVFSALVPGYLIPILGYKPLLLILSLGYLAAVAVIQFHFGDFRPVTMDATPASARG